MSSRHLTVGYHEVRRPPRRLLRAAGLGAALATVLVLALAWPGALGAALLVGALALFLWWCRTTRYEVRVRGDRLEVRFAPLRARSVPMEQVIACVPHMAYPWGEGPKGHRRVAGVDAWRAGLGAGLVVELAGGDALWVDCGHPERLASALKPRARRRRG